MNIGRITVLAVVFFARTAFAEVKCNCGEDCCWELVNGVLTITGSGSINGFENNKQPWKLSNINEVVIDSRITTIGERAFKGAVNLSKVTAEGVTTLDNSAFNGTALTSVNIPNLTNIGQSAFENVMTLTDETLDLSNVKEVGQKAFNGATGLRNVEMPNVEKIGQHAFINTQITSVTMNNVKEIANWAFENVSTLTNVEMEGVETVNQGAFSKTGLSSLYMPNVTDIAQSAFANIESLVSIYIPNVENVGDKAFDRDFALTYLLYPESANMHSNAYHTSGLGSQNCAIVDGNMQCAKCGDNFIMPGRGCVASCGKNYEVENGYCVRSSCDDGQVSYDGECLDDYPFARKHWTPEEANQWLKDDDNEIIITFKKSL